MTSRDRRNPEDRPSSRERTSEVRTRAEPGVARGGAEQEARIRINAWMAFETEGDSVVGQLVGRRRVVRDGGSEGEYATWVYQVYDEAGGEVVSFNGTFQINQSLGGLALGTRVRIEYTGKAKVPSGFTVKLFDIELLGVTAEQLVKALSAGSAQTSLPPGVDRNTGEFGGGGSVKRLADGARPSARMVPGGHPQTPAEEEPGQYDPPF